jgi:hypothetical protein
MDKNEILPPEKHYLDPSRDTVDPVGFALKKLQELLIWIDEHRSSFEKHRVNDPINADNELHCLKDATYQAILRLQRLTELILAGHGIDPKKAVPTDILNVVWVRAVDAIQRLALNRPGENEGDENKGDMVN